MSSNGGGFRSDCSRAALIESASTQIDGGSVTNALAGMVVEHTPPPR